MYLPSLSGSYSSANGLLFNYHLKYKQTNKAFKMAQLLINHEKNHVTYQK